MRAGGRVQHVMRERPQTPTPGDAAITHNPPAAIESPLEPREPEIVGFIYQRNPLRVCERQRYVSWLARIQFAAVCGSTKSKVESEQTPSKIPITMKRSGGRQNAGYFSLRASMRSKPLNC